MNKFVFFLPKNYLPIVIYVLVAKVNDMITVSYRLELYQSCTGVILLAELKLMEPKSHKVGDTLDYVLILSITLLKKISSS